MAIKEVPKQYSYTCDLCGVEHIEQSNGHCWESTPKGWLTARIKFNEVDTRGDGFKKNGIEEILMCPTHAADFNKYLEVRKNERT
jgi:hypothetical protein